MFLYNASPSVPVGFYRRDERSPELGALVTLRPPPSVRAYARSRGFDRPSDRFIKRIAARAGQRVCARGGEVNIDGRATARRLRQDGVGRVLPYWQGCHRLAGDEVFLLGDTGASFDGRYWGITRLDEIDGVWRPMGSLTQARSKRLPSQSSR